MFPGRLTDPQLGLRLKLVLPYFQASKLAYYCFMDAGKRSKALGSETEVLIPHSTASSISISMLTSVALGTPSAPQVPQGETEGQMEACTRSGLRYRKGTLSLRNLLFYCRR